MGATVVAVDAIGESGEGRPILPKPRQATLPDGTVLGIRALLPTDRDELALGYLQLSEQSQRRRFFSPPSRLSESLLDYLTKLDFDQRFALVAYMEGDPAKGGVGVARWVRDHDDPWKADAAVTVADRWQGRGIGTQLLIALVEAAGEHGITTFVADVLWENAALLETLRELGASIHPSEPGVARVEFALPPPGQAVHGTAVHRMLVASAASGA